MSKSFLKKSELLNILPKQPNSKTTYLTTGLQLQKDLRVQIPQRPNQIYMNTLNRMLYPI